MPVLQVLFLKGDLEQKILHGTEIFVQKSRDFDDGEYSSVGFTFGFSSSFLTVVEDKWLYPIETFIAEVSINCVDQSEVSITCVDQSGGGESGTLPRLLFSWMLGSYN